MWPSIGEGSTPWARLPSDVSVSFDSYVWGILGLGFGLDGGWNMYTVYNQLEKWAAAYQNIYEWTKTCYISMSRDDTRDLFSHLPFENASNYDIENEFRSAKFRITQLMNDHRLDKFLEEHYLSSLFEPNANNLCNYYDEDSYGNLKRDKPSHLNIFCMNIRSLPRHAGELIVFLKLLQTDFDIIVLTEIGARNISTVEHLLDDYEFLYTLPKSNMYGGVGLYLSKDITNVNILNNVCINKTCHCSKCDYESMLISFKFQKNEFIMGGIYRHPNGNMKHFVDDLERTLMTINGKTSCILAGDINIDIIKFENEGTMNYLTTLFSYRFLPYITLPSRISLQLVLTIFLFV